MYYLGSKQVYEAFSNSLFEKYKDQGKTPFCIYNIVSLEANSVAIIAGINLKRNIWPHYNGKRNIYQKDIKLAILILLLKLVSTRNEAFVF